MDLVDDLVWSIDQDHFKSSCGNGTFTTLINAIKISLNGPGRIPPKYDPTEATTIATVTVRNQTIPVRNVY